MSEEKEENEFLIHKVKKTLKNGQNKTYEYKYKKREPQKRGRKKKSIQRKELDKIINGFSEEKILDLYNLLKNAINEMNTNNNIN